MTGKTHVLAGTAIGCGLLLQSGLVSPLHSGLTFVCAAVGSLFPDIDQRTSKAGSAAPVASWLIQHTFGHRTLFHSPLLYLTAYTAVCMLWPQYRYYAFAFVLAAASHLLLDMLNSKGVPLLYPWRRRFHFTSFALGGLGELVIRGLLGLANVYLLGRGVLTVWKGW